VILFSDNEDEARRHVSHVVTFYREAGLQIMQDRYAVCRCF